MTQDERDEMYKLQEEMSMRELSGGHSIPAADLKRLMDLEAQARMDARDKSEDITSEIL